MTRVPFSPEAEPDEWVYTTAGRIACESCGEYVYPRRPVAGGASAFPPACLVCGEPILVGGHEGGRMSACACGKPARMMVHLRWPNGRIVPLCSKCIRREARIEASR